MVGYVLLILLLLRVVLGCPVYVVVVDALRTALGVGNGHAGQGGYV